MPTPEKVIRLVERFARNLEAYRSGKYKEPPVRKTTSQRQIHRLVYELYGLTQEEIRIVEEASQ